MATRLTLYLLLTAMTGTTGNTTTERSERSYHFQNFRKLHNPEFRALHASTNHITDRHESCCRSAGCISSLKVGNTTMMSQERYCCHLSTAKKTMAPTTQSVERYATTPVPFRYPPFHQL
jgi:hypothetical protein